MMVVVVYDISTESREGKRRLRKVSRYCRDWGIPVQASVCECEVNAEQYSQMRNKLETIIFPESDSIRFYLLGNHYQSRIETVGKRKDGWDRENFIL